MRWILSSFFCVSLVCCGMSVHAQNATVAWQHDGKLTTGYNVFCDNKTYPVQFVGTVPVGTQTFQLHGQPIGTKIYCRVRAYNSTGSSGDSPTGSAVIVKNNTNVITVLKITPQLDK